MTESNCHYLITKQVFYHLTNRATFYLSGLSTRIRTLDPFVPNEVRYQTALHWDNYYWWWWVDSSHWPTPYEGVALPLCYITIGAPRETRTPKILLLRQTRIPIPSSGQMLSVHRGNYSTSRRPSSIDTHLNRPSRIPSTHLPCTELSCCQRWLGRPHGWTHVLPLQQKNHPTDRQSVSLVRITLAVISCRFGCGCRNRTYLFPAYETGEFCQNSNPL